MSSGRSNREVPGVPRGPTSTRVTLADVQPSLADDYGDYELVLRPNVQQNSTPERKQAEPPATEVKPVLAARAASSRAAVLFRGMRGSKSLRTRLVSTYALTTSGAGSAYGAIPVYSTVVAIGEFGDFINLFDEFKVVSVSAHFIPYTPAKVEASVNTNGRFLVWDYAATDSTAPTGSQFLWANESAHCFSNQQVQRNKWGVLSSQPAVWYSTLSAVNPLYPEGSLKIAGDTNLGTSIPVGVVMLEFFVDFRMRR